MRVTKSTAAILLALAALSGCQHMPQSLSDLPIGVGPRNIALTAELPAPAARTWPDAEQDVLNQRARGYGLANIPGLQKYLDELLARIKVRAGVPDWPGRVYILATPALEAYATAAGNIYLSTSWIADATSEDELVALLGHEFGHIYLHYHQLEGAVQDADEFMKYTSVGVALARRTAQATGWTAVDSLATSYILGRELSTAAWGRGQESASDAFGLNLSLKLGYSYEHGMKVFLERLASWEENNAERQKTIREALLARIKQETRDKALKNRGGKPDDPVGNAIALPLADLDAELAGIAHQGGEAMQSIAKALTSKHPQVLTRLDTLAAAVETLPEEFTERTPSSAPLHQALRDEHTAGALKSYQLAVQALMDLDNPKSLELAQQAASGPGAHQALPLLALYKAQLAQSARDPKRKTPADHGAILEANLNSPVDRAWFVFVERSAQLEARGQRSAATRLMNQGIGHFEHAGQAWPQAIQFVGQTRGWNEAKQMASECSKRFRSMSEACALAATSPVEQAERERKSKEKADQLVNKWMKKR